MGRRHRDCVRRLTDLAAAQRGRGRQPASAIYVAIFNAAIGTGAFVGGQLIASAGLSEMVWLAAGIMVGSTLLIALLKAPLPGQISAATAGA